MMSAANGGGGDDAGVHLAINHFRSAALGDVVLARAIPFHLGRSTQAWEVKLWKMDPSEEGKKGPQIAESRVTLLCNLPLPDNLHHAGDALKNHMSDFHVSGLEGWGPPPLHAGIRLIS